MISLHTVRKYNRQCWITEDFLTHTMYTYLSTIKTAFWLLRSQLYSINIGNDMSVSVIYCVIMFDYNKHLSELAIMFGYTCDRYNSTLTISPTAIFPLILFDLSKALLIIHWKINSNRNRAYLVIINTMRIYRQNV